MGSWAELRQGLYRPDGSWKEAFRSVRVDKTLEELIRNDRVYWQTVDSGRRRVGFHSTNQPAARKTNLYVVNAFSVREIQVSGVSEKELFHYIADLPGRVMPQVFPVFGVSDWMPDNGKTAPGTWFAVGRDGQVLWRKKGQNRSVVYHCEDGEYLLWQARADDEIVLIDVEGKEVANGRFANSAGGRYDVAESADGRYLALLSRLEIEYGADEKDARVTVERRVRKLKSAKIYERTTKGVRLVADFPVR